MNQSEISKYIIERLDYHSERNDAQSCIALIEEFSEWLDEEIN